METAALIPKGVTARQTIIILYGNGQTVAMSSKMKFLGDNWFVDSKRRDYHGLFSVTIHRDFILEILPCSVNYEIRLIGTCGACISRNKLRICVPRIMTSFWKIRRFLQIA
uniref:Uncharacterized protein n=1 Tax=Ditylenchus dipsaci TaxID=166011 RepID=A0A915DKX2_9BILA